MHAKRWDALRILLIVKDISKSTLTIWFSEGGKTDCLPDFQPRRANGVWLMLNAISAA